jgi:hypothetical protein
MGGSRLEGEKRKSLAVKRLCTQMPHGRPAQNHLTETGGRGSRRAFLATCIMRKIAEKQAIYAKYDLQLIELGDPEIERLDDVLPRMLLRVGIEIGRRWGKRQGYRSGFCSALTALRTSAPLSAPDFALRPFKAGPNFVESPSNFETR